MVAEPKYMKQLTALMNEYPDTPSCTCSECRDMCIVPCWPLPHQVMKMIRRGYGDRLQISTHRVGTDKRCPLLVPVRKARDGEEDIKLATFSCVFQQNDGKCELHDLGLKPFEGRVVDHSDVITDQGVDLLRGGIAEMWHTLSGRAMVRWWIKHHGSPDDKERYGKVKTEKVVS